MAFVIGCISYAELVEAWGSLCPGNPNMRFCLMNEFPNFIPDQPTKQPIGLTSHGH